MAQASAAKLVLTGSAEKERVASMPHLVSAPEPSLPKGKEIEPSV